MNKEVELHDSEISTFLVEKDSGILSIKGIMHYSEGQPGVDAGTCWLQNIELQFSGISTLKIPDHIPEIISEGRLVIDGSVFENMFELPNDISGEIELDLLTMYNEQFYVKVNRINGTAIGEPKYIQDFAGN
jgi:hypothetical protein